MQKIHDEEFFRKLEQQEEEFLKPCEVNFTNENKLVEEDWDTELKEEEEKKKEEEERKNKEEDWDAEMEERRERRMKEKNRNDL